jgi:hypothetical protein
MPVPELDVVRQIGQAVERIQARDCVAIERTVGKAVGLSKQLIEQVCQMAEGHNGET